MKLEELKNKYDKEVEKLLLTDKEKEKVINKFEELFKLDNEFNEKRMKKKDKMDQLARTEISDFFNREGFEVVEDKNDDIIAKYKNLEIEISELKTEETHLIYHIRLTNKRDVVPFYYGEMREIENNYCWKHVIKIKNEILMQGNYKDELNKCKELDVLVIISHKLDENIEQMKKILKNIDDNLFYYTMPYNEGSFRTFKELFETTIEL